MAFIISYQNFLFLMLDTLVSKNGFSQVAMLLNPLISVWISCQLTAVLNLYASGDQNDFSSQMQECNEF